MASSSLDILCKHASSPVHAEVLNRYRQQRMAHGSAAKHSEKNRTSVIPGFNHRSGIVRMEDRRFGRQSRILVIPATSGTQGQQQAERIIGSIIACDSSAKDAEVDAIEDGLIPWHISNRYYEADVHFKIAPTSAPPTKRGETMRRIQLRDAPVEEATDDQVRDVFAALQLAPPPASSFAGKEKNDQAAIGDEAAGVQAVLLLVDRDTSVQEHRKSLQRIGVSGFDLAISLIVALPTPLNDDGVPSNLSGIYSSEEVEELYTGEGWEYVDLADVNRHLDTDSSDEQDGTDEEFADDEKIGLERVREALMMHTWPGLERNSDRERGADLVNSVSAYTATSNLAELRTGLEAIDDTVSVQPTEKDEQLARAFLARIEATQSSVSRDAASQAPTIRTNADMQANLQRFLEEEDSQWPTSMRKHDDRETDDDAWRPDSAARSINHGQGGTAFEDDFSDFVQAGTSAEHHDGTQPALGADFDCEEDLAFMGDGDDALLMRALDARRSEGDEKVQIDFESTLHAVLAHAERVRSIPDHEQRREEAARVALALLDQ